MNAWATHEGAAHRGEKWIPERGWDIPRPKVKDDDPTTPHADVVEDHKGMTTPKYERDCKRRCGRRPQGDDDPKV